MYHCVPVAAGRDLKRPYTWATMPFNAQPVYFSSPLAAAVR